MYLFCFSVLVGVYGIYRNEEDFIFDFVWHDASELENLNTSVLKESDRLRLSTNNNEIYNCFMPMTELPPLVEKPSNASNMNFTETLLLFHRNEICSLKAESYWSFELCHGSYIKQYHDEKLTDNSVNFQEFFLGHFNLKRYLKNMESDSQSKVVVRYVQNKKYLGIPVPYTEGTLCDLLGDEPRSATVIYVCDKTNEGIIQVNEVSTCNYEIIFSASWVCDINEISNAGSSYPIRCFADANSPKIPSQLHKLEEEQTKVPESYKQYPIKITTKDGQNFLIKLILKTGSKQPNEVFLDAMTAPNEMPTEQAPTESSNLDQMSPAEFDAIPSNAKLKRYLINKCITGEDRSYKIEFCYEDHVTLYYMLPDSSKMNSLTIGYWDLENHVKKRLSSSNGNSLLKKYISLFYTNGDFFPKTDIRCEVEVRLTCIEEHVNEDEANDTFKFFLLNPSIGNYILVVESPVFCDIINQLDQDGVPKLQFSEING